MSTPGRRARAHALYHELHSQFPAATFEQVSTPEEGGVVVSGGTTPTEDVQIQAIYDAWDWTEKTKRRREVIEQAVLDWLREPATIAGQANRLQIAVARIASVILRQHTELAGGIADVEE